MINVPNALTLFRILLVPVFLFFVSDDRYYAATIVFVAASLTDVMDGFIARTFKQQTAFGRSIDPVADKLLMVSALVALTIKEIIPLWLTVPIIIKDAVQSLGVFALKFTGRKITMRPTVFGKSSTVLQAVAIAYAMVISSESAPFNVIAAITVAVTLYAGVNYMIKIKRQWV